MLQIAADELEVSPERIDLLTGDTETTPNEGYTAGSQSIQFGGVALAASPAPRCASCSSIMLLWRAVAGAPTSRCATA